MATNACQAAVGPSLAGQVSGYDASFVPLGFACLVPGGERYEVFVPGYVNPTVLALLVLTIVLVVMATARTAATSSPAEATGRVAP